MHAIWRYTFAMTVRLAFTICLAMGLAIVNAASCRESQVVPFTYPPSWPIEVLRVPGGAAQINVPDGRGGSSDQLYLDGELLQEGTRFEHHDWQVAFSSDARETELVNYFDGLLRLESFMLWHTGVPKYGKRVYVTKDNKLQVAFEWQDTQREDKSGRFKGYVLTISAYTEEQIDVAGTREIPVHGKPPAEWGDW